MRNLSIGKLGSLVALQAGALLVACASESRNEPAPAEMCEELVEHCQNLGTNFTRACYRAGRAGLNDPSSEDQCLASYAKCIDECVLLSEERPQPNGDKDSGSDKGEAGAGDGDASTPAETGDASTPAETGDASTPAETGDASAPADAGDAGSPAEAG